MSISDVIVVMKEGVVQQIGEPQKVYDDPANLFVAKFLGTPPINVFRGRVRGEKLWIGEECVLDVPGVSDREAYVGIRPEGLVLSQEKDSCETKSRGKAETGRNEAQSTKTRVRKQLLSCRLSGVEVMGRDISVVAVHEASEGPSVRAVISAEQAVDSGSSEVQFRIRPDKLFLFDRETEKRIFVAS